MDDVRSAGARPNASPRRRAARHIGYFYHTFSFRACADEARIGPPADWTKVHYLRLPFGGTMVAASMAAQNTSSLSSSSSLKEPLGVKRLLTGWLSVGF